MITRHERMEGRGDVLEVAHAVHRLPPAVVPQQVERHQFEARNVGAGGGERCPHLAGLPKIAHGAANNVTRLQQLQRDMPGDVAGDAGDEDAIGHLCLH
jgi:hypothetical protein